MKTFPWQPDEAELALATRALPCAFRAAGHVPYQPGFVASAQFTPPESALLENDEPFQPSSARRSEMGAKRIPMPLVPPPHC